MHSASSPRRESRLHACNRLHPIAHCCNTNARFPTLQACTGNSIAIDSHADRRVVAASRILFLAFQTIFLSERSPEERGPEFPPPGRSSIGRSPNSCGG